MSDLILSLVIPTYNERGNIEQLIAELCSILDREIPNRYELILVDDDSPDRTWELAEQVGKTCNQVRVLRRKSVRGLLLLSWPLGRSRAEKSGA